MKFDEVCIALWTESDDDSHGVLSAVDRLKKAHDLDIQDQLKCFDVLQQLCALLETKNAVLRQQLPEVAIVKYYAGDYVCECGLVVDTGAYGTTQFNYCAGCGSKLNWAEVEK